MVNKVTKRKTCLFIFVKSLRVNKVMQK